MNKSYPRLQALAICGQYRSIETAQVMEELVDMARKFREAIGRGEDLRLSEEAEKLGEDWSPL